MQVQVQVQVVVFKCDASGNLLRLPVDGHFEDLPCLRISNRLLFCHHAVDVLKVTVSSRTCPCPLCASATVCNCRDASSQTHRPV